ncbi:MAG: hypothetical protein IKD19_05420, partial [Prevotella sp.]|nr:hypothetical protein [Prevotella sp.]
MACFKLPCYPCTTAFHRTRRSVLLAKALLCYPCALLFTAQDALFYLPKLCYAFRTALLSTVGVIQSTWARPMVQGHSQS